jgi:hypothetical protein
MYEYCAINRRVDVGRTDVGTAAEAEDEVAKAKHVLMLQILHGLLGLRGRGAEGEAESVEERKRGVRVRGRGLRNKRTPNRHERYNAS